jgi:DNA mismatch repair protein MutL
MVNMPKVKVLPADVVSKIAAGEVVERPAAVVKELLENALDAGATRVEVQVKDGGKSSIVIKDNGSGIERADLETIFTRHATSKIKSANDLDNILSLGFRGEALYSIAAVSEVTLKTRAEKFTEAWEMFLKGGQREKFMPAAIAEHGTEIRVDEIFFNTPARKKFLKSDSAEFDQILHIFVPYALLYPTHHFVLTHNGRSIYNLPHPGGEGGYRERVAAVLNLDPRHIIETAPISTPDKVTIKLLLGDINIQRPRRDQQFIFVNHRPVQHRNISYHVNEIYKLIFPDGVHPFFAVFLELPPEDVDVNIHPTKREVRIHQEGRFTGFLRNTVEQALMTKGGAKEAGGTPADVFTFDSPIVSREEGVPADRIVFAPGQGKGQQFLSSDVRRRTSDDQDNSYVAPSFFSDHLPKADTAIKDRLLIARFIGTFADKYHLFEEGSSLFLVDQHAAQERILFERFKRQIDSNKVEVQPLLTPLVLKLTPGEMLAWEELKDSLKDIGFETTLFGEGAIALQAYPMLLDNPENAVRALIGGEEVPLSDRFAKVGGPEARKDALARRACRASVMAGDRMIALEAVGQLRALLACQDPMTCPHGRPVFVEFKEGFLDRQFLRT